MDAIIRGAAIYVFLMVVMRLAGRRTLGELTAFDFVLLLVIGEATQQALLGDNFSLTNAFLVILTLVGLDIGLSLVKRRSPAAEKWMDGRPTVLVEDGRVMEERLDRARVGKEDILDAARKWRGLERLDQIKYAVLEANGDITVVPRGGDRGGNT